LEEPDGETGEIAGLSIKVFYGNKILRNQPEFKGILKKWRPGIASRDATVRLADIPVCR
jgi:hypothetical protein